MSYLRQVYRVIDYAVKYRQTEMFYTYIKITTISHGKLHAYITIIIIKWQVNDAGNENAKNSNDSLSSVYLIIYLFLSNNNNNTSNYNTVLDSLNSSIFVIFMLRWNTLT